jgi:hypothetical protein
MFYPHAKNIAQQIATSLNYFEDDDIKLLVLQLLSEIATNYTEQI